MLAIARFGLSSAARSSTLRWCAGISSWSAAPAGITLADNRPSRPLKGTVRTVIDSTFAMNQAADAFDKLANGRAVGKIMITVK